MCLSTNSKTQYWIEKHGGRWPTGSDTTKWMKRERKPPLPNIFLTNVCSLSSKMDELKLQVEMDRLVKDVVFCFSLSPGFIHEPHYNVSGPN